MNDVMLGYVIGLVIGLASGFFLSWLIRVAREEKQRRDLELDLIACVRNLEDTRLTGSLIDYDRMDDKEGVVQRPAWMDGG